MQDKQKKWKIYLYLAFINTGLLIGLFTVTWVFHLLHLMDTHLLEIVKNIFTEKPFSPLLFIFVLVVATGIGQLFLVLFYSLFPDDQPLAGEILFTLLFVGGLIYGLPFFYMTSFQWSFYSMQTVIHFFCFVFIYAIWLGETIRFYRFL